MNSIFSKFADPKFWRTVEFSELCKKLDAPPKAVASWIYGASIPHYASQLKICEVLGCSLRDLRRELNQPYSPFGEYLIVRILPHGKILDFPQKTGLKPSAYNTWLSGKSVPRGVATLDRIADALILWGDRTPKRRLVAELIDAVEKSIADQKKRRKLSSKNTKDCNFARIAA
jgi:transcriptional regulator with XRE-family HTH domain